RRPAWPTWAGTWNWASFPSTAPGAHKKKQEGRRMKSKGNRSLAACACVLAVLAAAPARAQSLHPADRWEFALEAGYLTKVKNNSPHDHRIVPLQVASRSPSMTDLSRSPDATSRPL